MALWKDQYGREQGVEKDKEPIKEVERAAATVVSYEPAARAASVAQPKGDAKESLIAADLTIEGKVEGAGHIRIAGNFKGDVNVQGDLAIESGAKLTGSVRADNVTIAGELEGNVVEATRVELTQSAVVIGDVKGDTLTVVSGARMRGHAEFGWSDDKSPKAGSNVVGRPVS